MALLFIHPEMVVRTVVTKPPSTLVRQTILPEHFAIKYISAGLYH
jgi:hypothetical protein